MSDPVEAPQPKTVQQVLADALAWCWSSDENNTPFTDAGYLLSALSDAGFQVVKLEQVGWHASGQFLRYDGAHGFATPVESVEARDERLKAMGWEPVFRIVQEDEK